MASVKLAISISKPLYKQAEAVARRMKVPRSKLYAMALEEFLHRYTTKQLMEKLNESYQEPFTAEEEASFRTMQKLYWNTVTDKW